MKILLTYYHADWCMVCKYAEPVLDNLVNDYINRGFNVEVQKVDITDGGQPDNVKVLPTLILEGNGNWVQLDGAGKEEIEKVMSQIIGSVELGPAAVINTLDEALNNPSETIGYFFTPIKSVARKKGKAIIVTALALTGLALFFGLAYLVFKSKKK